MLELVRAGALSRFAELLRLRAEHVYRVYIVSPWIVTGTRDAFVPLNQVVAALQNARSRVTVVTRPPASEVHAAAVRVLASIPTADILFRQDLHAKVYLMESDGFRMALLGSANFTPPGDRHNLELSVDVRSVRASDSEAEFINQLTVFLRQLAGGRLVTVHKRGSPPVRH